MASDNIKRVPLFIPRSSGGTESNKTGSWRFLKPLYQEKTAPCGAGCPAGEDVARIQMLASQGLFKEAWETVLMENPFPGVCGRICSHACETVCNRGEYDQPVAIHAIERFLADMAARYDLKPTLEVLPPRREKIAIAGAGPSGLAAAWFLARLGYACDVYEAMSEPGGLLRWGIPPYRLPATAVEDAIERIRDLGVTFHCGKPLDEGFLQQVRDSHDAAVLACGCSRGRRLMISGEDLPGVEDGLSFLRRIAAGETPAVRGTVAVIGGGNTAIDTARCVRRLGAKALLVYRRRREDMPAFEGEIAMALEEGVELIQLRSPAKIEVDAEALLLTLQHMRVLEEKPGGRALVGAEPEKTESVRVNHVFKAVGFDPAEIWMSPPGEAAEGVLRLSGCVMARAGQGMPVVYAGDLTNAEKSVVHAVASGKEAAMALDSLFREGIDSIRQRLAGCSVGCGSSLSMEIYMQGERSRRSSHVVRYGELNTDHFQFAPRIVLPRLLKEERVRSFAEIDLKISAGLAIREAERCFNCGLCNQCDNCRLFCPDLAVKRDESPRGRRIDYDYCKGCGICVVECPRNAMRLEEEAPAEATAGGEEAEAGSPGDAAGRQKGESS